MVVWSQKVEKQGDIIASNREDYVKKESNQHSKFEG